jgi:hypothetical protein
VTPHIEAPWSRFPSASQWFGSTAPQYAGSGICVGTHAAQHAPPQVARLRAELEGLGLREIRQRAAAAGASADAIDDARDREDAREALIELVLASGGGGASRSQRPHFGARGQQQESGESAPTDLRLLSASGHVMLSYEVTTARWGPTARRMHIHEAC